MAHVISLDEDSQSLKLVKLSGDRGGIGLGGFDLSDSFFDLLEGFLSDSSGGFGQSDDEAVRELLVLRVLVIGSDDNSLSTGMTPIKNYYDSSRFITKS